MTWLALTPFLLATADPVAGVERAQVLLEKGPISFIAIVSLGALGLTVRELLKVMRERLEDMRLLADVSKKQENTAKDLADVARTLSEASEPRRRRRKTQDEMPAVRPDKGDGP